MIHWYNQNRKNDSSFNTWIDKFLAVRSKTWLLTSLSSSLSKASRTRFASAERFADDIYLDWIKTCKSWHDIAVLVEHYILLFIRHKWKIFNVLVIIWCIENKWQLPALSRSRASWVSCNWDCSVLESWTDRTSFAFNFCLQDKVDGCGLLGVYTKISFRLFEVSENAPFHKFWFFTMFVTSLLNKMICNIRVLLILPVKLYWLNNSLCFWESLRGQWFGLVLEGNTPLLICDIIHVIWPTWPSVSSALNKSYTLKKIPQGTY
jgi:hypothetical protein